MNMKFFAGLMTLSLILSSCATKVVPHNETAPIAPASHSAPAPASAPAPVQAHTPYASAGVAPEKALKWLKNGNQRFTKGTLRNDGQSQKDIAKLSTGQAPHTVILACSDSRVPPEVVFDQKLGEVFVIRVAGEALDNSAIGSIEYAVEHLGTRLLVVMGHSSCGAVKAALGTLDGSDAGSPALNAMVHDIHPRIASFKRSIASKDVVDESWANTRGAAHDLLSRSKILQEKVHSGELIVKTALYHLDHGNVDFDP